MRKLIPAKTAKTFFFVLLSSRTEKAIWKLRLAFFTAFLSVFASSYGQAPTLSYSGPNVYALGGPITPLAPTSSSVNAPAYGPAVNIGLQFTRPNAVAIDAAGNLYIADQVGSTNDVQEIPANGGPVITLASGLQVIPTAITVDSARNVYFCGSNKVYKIPAGGGAAVVIGTGFQLTYGIAADAAGNVYVANSAGTTVNEILANGGGIITVGSGFSHPYGLALDTFGNLYISDSRNHALKEIPAGSSSVVTLSTAFSDPRAISVDVSGNVYVYDIVSGQSVLDEVPANGSAPFALLSNVAEIQTICLGAGGIIYLTMAASDGTFTLDEYTPFGGYYLKNALPAGLSLNISTGVISGTPTVVSPAANYTVTAYNVSGGASATVNITVSGSLSNGLTNLAISSGSLHPAFAAGTTSYTASVGNVTNTITVTPTASDPTYTIKVNGTAVASGAASAAVPLNVGANTISILVVSQDGSGSETYTLNVTRAASANAKLLSLTTSSGALTPTFNNTVTSYTRSVANSVTEVSITPTVVDPTASVTVNGIAVVSGAASNNIAVNVGSNVISTVVTAQDGVSTMTYTITVNRAASADATLSNLGISTGNIKPAFTSANTAYNVAVGNGTNSVSLTPTSTDTGATIKIGANIVASGTASPPIPLSVGANNLSVFVTAQNGITTKSYKITVTRAPSSNAKLYSLTTSNGVLTPAFNNTQPNYTRNVPSSVDSIMLTARSVNNAATIMIAGQTTPSGVGVKLGLVPGNNYENILVTAQDNVTTMIYSVNVIRAMGAADAVYEPVSVEKPLTNPTINDNDINVHQSLSPNGDGINDFLVIENIVNYPDNRLTITNRSGQLIFESKNYDNSSKVFDGHSNKTGAMQLPGTYFYSLDYSSGGVMKHKTGFIVVRY